MGSSLPLTLINFEQGSRADLTPFRRVRLATLAFRVRLATLAFPVGPSHYHRSLNADSYTPLAIMVYPSARHITAVTSLSCAALVPAKRREPLCPQQVLPLRRNISCHIRRRPFPTLSLQSLRRCLDPYPAVFSWCSCSLLPRRQRPHLRHHKFGTPNYSCNATLTRGTISGLQSFLYVQAPTLDRPPRLHPPLKH